MNGENVITGPLVLSVQRNLLRRINSAKWKRRAVGAPFSVALIAKEFCFGLLAASVTLHSAAIADAVVPMPTLSHLSDAKVDTAPSPTEAQARVAQPKRAHFASVRPSHKAQNMADWVVDSGDNGGMPFAIVDKEDAKVFVFNADGRLHGTTPVLLGLAVGDDAVPGIGDRPLSSIRDEERTTPAGRVVAELDRNLRGKEILWVDYDGAVSMHPVVSTSSRERRLERLASPSPLDNRISYGCINVPTKFFADVIRPTFTGTNGIVYVLPETKSLNEVFESYTEASKD